MFPMNEQNSKAKLNKQNQKLIHNFSNRTFGTKFFELVKRLRLHDVPYIRVRIPVKNLEPIFIILKTGKFSRRTLILRLDLKKKPLFRLFFKKLYLKIWGSNGGGGLKFPK